MSKLPHLFLSLSLLIAGVYPVITHPPAAVAAQTDSLRVMILPFRNLTRAPEDDWLGESFAESLTMGLLKVEALQLVERGQIGAVLKEQQFGQSAYVDESNAPKLGKLLGAKIVVLGSYQKIGDQLQANVRFVDVETGSIDAKRSAQIQGSFNQIFDLQKKLATDLVSQLKVTARPDELANMDSVLKATDSTEAYKQYISGLQLIRKGGSLNLDKAQTAFRAALQADPAYALAMAGLAEVHSRKARNIDMLRVPPPNATMGIRGPDDASMARRYAEEALALNPDLPQVLRALAWVEQIEGDKPRAMELIRRSIQLNPSDSDSLMAFVNFKLENGDSLEVKQFTTELENLGAKLEDPWIQFTLGTLTLSVETSKATPNLTLSRSLLESAQKKLPENPNIPLSLMAVAQREGKPDEAERHFERAMSLGKDNPELLAGLSAIRMSQKRPEDALSLTEQGLKLNPDSLFVKLTHAQALYALGRKAESEAINDAIEQKYPKNVYAYFSRGIKYFVYGQDAARAKVQFQKALKLTEEEPSGMTRATLVFFLAVSELNDKAYAEAQGHFEELLKDPLYYGQAYELLARAHNLQEHHTEALEAYSAYLTAYPEVAESEQIKQQYRWYYLLDQLTQDSKNVAVLNDLGQLAQLRKNPEQAENYFKSALALEPKNVVVLYNLGSFYLQSGKPQQARPLLMQAVAIKADYTKAWYNLGLTLQALGDAAGAHTAMQKVLGLEPEHEGARKALSGG